VELAEFEYIDYKDLEKAYAEELKPIPNIMTDPFKEKWETTKASYRKISRFGHCNTYDLLPVMVKANDDCR